MFLLDYLSCCDAANAFESKETNSIVCIFLWFFFERTQSSGYQSIRLLAPHFHGLVGLCHGCSFVEGIVTSHQRVHDNGNFCVHFLFSKLRGHGGIGGFVSGHCAHVFWGCRLHSLCHHLRELRVSVVDWCAKQPKHGFLPRDFLQDY